MDTISSAKMARYEASTDRINDLPKNVVDNIMQFLSILDAARTSVLSKKWRSNWVSIPQLVFDDEFARTFRHNDEFDASKWRSMISNILFVHEGPIIKFSLTFSDSESSDLNDINSWISFVSRNGVKSLTLVNWDFSDNRVPSHLFSCVALESLTLHGFTIGSLPCLRGFRNLLSLELAGDVFGTGMFSDFIASCPNLEILTLSYCCVYGPLVFIDMPNLKKLSIEGTFDSISFKNAPSLFSMSLALGDMEIVEGAVDMIKFLASSCKLQRLCLDGGSCQLLANSGISRILPTTFKQLKILELLCIGTNDMNEVVCVVGLIRSCLNMEELSVSVDPDYLYTEGLEISVDDETNTVKLGHSDNGPEYTFNYLCRVYIKGLRGFGVEMKLIAYLLAFSPSLERLSFTCHHTVEAAKELQLYRQMLQFTRASPKAKVVYLKI